MKKMARLRPSILLLGLVTLLLTIWYFMIEPRMPRGWLAYSTRPLWDHDERPRTRLRHHHTESIEGVDKQELCKMHGWELRNQSVEVWDATIFSTELSLLLIRLHELSPIVTHHFILESTHSFTGIPKPLLLADALETPDFKPYRNRIRYRSIRGRELASGENPFVQENDMRAAMTSFIREHLPETNHSGGPILLFSDVDEVVSRSTAQLLQTCAFEFPLHLGLNDYLYSFEFEAGGILKGASSWRAQATQWPRAGQGPDEFFRHGKVSETMLVDSGWHCSWCFKTVEEFVTKAKGYSHADRLGNRPTALLRPERIQKTICDGLDMFAMLPEAYSWKEMVSKWRMLKSSGKVEGLPSLLRERPHDFKWLLPGGCVREQR